MNEKLLDMLHRHEGFRQFPYRCTSGKLTIGIGRNIEDRGISLHEAKLLLRNDIAIVDGELRNALEFFDTLGTVRQCALIDMGVNMGTPTLLTFKNTMRYLAEEDFEEAGAEILRGSGPDGKSRYYCDVGQRAETISEMIKTGEWQ